MSMNLDPLQDLATTTQNAQNQPATTNQYQGLGGDVLDAVACTADLTSCAASTVMEAGSGFADVLGAIGEGLGQLFGALIAGMFSP